MDATCTIQNSIHVFRLVRQYVSRILGTYHSLELRADPFLFLQKAIADNKKAIGLSDRVHLI